MGCDGGVYRLVQRLGLPLLQRGQLCVESEVAGPSLLQRLPQADDVPCLRVDHGVGELRELLE